jgi:anti-anti-sigma factor
VRPRSHLLDAGTHGGARADDRRRLTTVVAITGDDRLTPLPFEGVGSEEHLRIEVRTAPDRVVLELHGELDLLGAPLLQEQIDEADLDARGILVLDLQDLQFIDSAGLRVVLVAHGNARRHGREFAVTKGSDQVQRLLSIAGVDERLRIIASPDDVLV